MEILKAAPSDLIEVLYLLRVCIFDMNEKGMKQWNSAYPDRNIIRQHLDNSQAFLVKDKGVLKGMVFITNDVHEDYKELLGNEEQSGTLFLKWLSIHPLWQGIGIDTQLLEFAEIFARSNNHSNIKLDVFTASDQTDQMVRAHQFSEIGKYYTSFQKTPYSLFVKKLE